MDTLRDHALRALVDRALRKGQEDPFAADGRQYDWPDAGRALYNATKAAAADLGFRVVVADQDHSPRSDNGAVILAPLADATTWTVGKVTVVRKGLVPGFATRTLLHEYGHMVLHPPSYRLMVPARYGYLLSQAGADALVEAEAEAMAFALAERAGFDTRGYSEDYITSWFAGITPDLEPMMRADIDEVVVAAVPEAWGRIAKHLLA